MARQKSRRVDHHRICQPDDCLYGQQVRIGNHSEQIRRANRCRPKPRVSDGIFTISVRLKAGKHRNESTQRKCRLNMCSGGVLLGGIGAERLKKGFRRSLGVW
ncbi:hypothetical protein EZZ76_10250 [Neisseria meningitidis]|nr:hypothetical protein [Neisseria meningitidis]